MSDYRDFIIKNGEFVGAFEEMYQHSQDPWHQRDESRYYPSRDIAALLLRDRKIQTLLDVGCGTGALTRRFVREVGARVIGVDVSRTAVLQLRRDYAQVACVVADIPPLPIEADSVDAVVISELLWYVLPHIHELFDEVRRVLVSSGLFLVVQQFYGRGRQQFGKDVMTTPRQLIAMLPFVVLHWIQIVDPATGDYRAIILGRKES